MFKKIRLRPEKDGTQVALYDLEADIMDVVWSSDWEAFSVRDVLEELEQERDIAYTTVMTTVKRLFDKGFSLWKRWRPSHRTHQATCLEGAARRVHNVCNGHAQLEAFSERIHVVDCAAHVCATIGMFNQRIEIAASLVERLDDAALEAALLHDVAHFSLHDPARSFFLLLAQIINPFSRVLSNEASAWRFAREIVCDGHAVDCGARPVSVADAIVTAAKAAWSTSPGACAHLCGTRLDALSACINLLLNGTRPSPNCSSSVKVPAIGSAVLTFLF